MKKKEDYLNKIEDFTNVELPNVEMKDADKEQIKENIMKLINKLQERNLDEFEINVSEEDINTISENIDKDSDRRVYGVKDSKVMKQIIEQTIANELRGEKIIKSIEYELPSIVYWGRSAIFNYAYITETDLVWFGFDIEYKLVSKGRDKLSNIKSVGRVREKISEYEETGIEFWIRGEEAYFALIIYGDKKVKEMDEFIQYFIDKGAKVFDQKKFAFREMLFYAFTWGVAAIGIFFVLREIFRLA
ncbi:MAG: hypothetical protein ACRCWM_02220 [Sarcina sp.]